MGYNKINMPTTSKAAEALKSMINDPRAVGVLNKEIKGDGVSIFNQEHPKDYKIKKEGVLIPTVDKRKFNGGHHTAGRKPSIVKQEINGVKQWKEKWYHEKVTLTTRDPATNSLVKKTLPRYAWLYEKLFNMSLVEGGDHAALKEIMDRNEGKSMQPIGNAHDEPFRMQVNIGIFLQKSGYGEKEE